jgi:hypothetical protein
MLVMAGTAGSAFAAEPGEQVRAAEEQGDPAREARAAGVPAEDIAVIVNRSRERGVAAEQVRDMIRIITHTREQNLPVRAVLDRIEQGLAKGVPAERIAAAARRLEEHLAAAMPLVDALGRQGLRPAGAREREDAIESVARAREQAIPDGILAGTGTAVRTRGQTMAQFDRAVRTMTLLAGNGMSAGPAAQVVRECVDHDFIEKDYAKLERNMIEMLRRGRPMEDVVRAAEREIRERPSRDDSRGDRQRDRGFGGREAGGRGSRGR